jgi:hypothetical protein
MFIASLYADILGRTASGAEIAGWLPTLQATNRAFVVDAFLNSQEVNQKIVNSFYKDFLRRPGTYLEKQPFVAGLTSHQYNSQILAEAILASDQYYAMAVAASQQV